MGDKKVVLDYLMENVNFADVSTLADNLQEVGEGFTEIPEGIHEAYDGLSQYERWGIIAKLAAKGKAVAKEQNGV